MVWTIADNEQLGETAGCWANVGAFFLGLCALGLFIISVRRARSFTRVHSAGCARLVRNTIEEDAPRLFSCSGWYTSQLSPGSVSLMPTVFDVATKIAELVPAARGDGMRWRGTNGRCFLSRSKRGRTVRW